MGAVEALGSAPNVVEGRPRTGVRGEPPGTEARIVAADVRLLFECP